MDFSLTDEQRIIRDTARSLFDRECTPDLVRRAWEAPEAALPLWRDHLHGWVGLSTGSPVDIAIFMEEYGRALVPGVFFATLLAAFAASTVDESIDGPATIAVAGPDGIWTPNEAAEKCFVPSAAQASQVVVISGSSAAPRLAVLARDELVLVPVQQMDESRPLYGVRPVRDGVGRRITPQDWQQVVQRALVCCSAELVGVGRHLLDSAVEYAKVRQQFGRPIGSFQGLQWKLVDAALELERAASAVAWAALCVDEGAPEAQRAVHCAKLEAGLAARLCARTSLQVHGGIGYTWEHGLHFWLRRAYAGDAFLGPSDYHARCLAELLFAA
jgi:alkylation response protein AidB-like acyl-CoA dehydrogenase